MERVLAADIGGSTVRLRSIASSGATDIGAFPIRCRDDFLRVLRERACGNWKWWCLAIAGARRGDAIEVANWNRDHTLDLRELPMYRAGRCTVINDLEACGYGLMTPGSEKYFKVMHQGTHPVVSKESSLVMGLGTGLGAAFIVNGHVIPSELGYLQSCGVCTNHSEFSSDSSTLEWVSSKFYNGSIKCGYEDLSSSYGLLRHSARLGGPNTVKEIVEKAKSGDPIATRAMVSNYRYLMRCARQGCIGMNCGSVVLALSNQVENKWLMDLYRDVFIQEFLDSHRTLSSVTVSTQCKHFNFNLAGAAAIASSHIAYRRKR